MTAGFETSAFGEVVVNFAVVDDAGGAVRIPHRLRTVGDIDDAQPAMPEADAPVNANPGSVRPAMLENIAHRDKAFFIDLTSGMCRKCYAVNAAHLINRPVSIRAATN